jgi:hypothetical protein
VQFILKKFDGYTLFIITLIYILSIASFEFCGIFIEYLILSSIMDTFIFYKLNRKNLNYLYCNSSLNCCNIYKKSILVNRFVFDKEKSNDEKRQFKLKLKLKPKLGISVLKYK